MFRKYVICVISVYSAYFMRFAYAWNGKYPTKKERKAKINKIKQNIVIVEYTATTTMMMKKKEIKQQPQSCEIAHRIQIGLERARKLFTMYAYV